MKKILLPILALGGLLFASSCQMDEPDAGTLTGEVDFTITAGIPGSINTYSPEDGEAFSHLGGANNVNSDEYDLRYILKVYDDETLAYEEIQTVKSDFTGEKVNFSARLLAKKYTFVLWADFVKEGTKNDLYYNTQDLTMVSYTSTVTDDFNMRAKYLSSDAIDAYTAYQEINLSESSQNVNISLKRPFGKIRLLATDAPDNNDANTQIPNKVSIKFAEDTWVPSTYNAKIGQVSEGNSILIEQYSFDAIREVQPQVTGHDELAEEDNSAYLLGQTYIFASESIPSYKMTVTTYSDEYLNAQIGYRELTNIPVSANKLTTIIGNFYTNEGNIDVVVDDMFDEDETVYDVPETINVTTSAGIQDAIDAAQDGDIIVIGPGTYGAFDVTKSETQSFFQLPTDKSLTFRGANAGVAGIGSRSEETVITIPFTYAHSTTTTADFTFDGLKFTENGRVSVGKASTGDLTFINNIVTGITINSDPGTTFFTTPYVYDNNSYTMEDIVVENNLVDGTTLSDGTNSCGFRMWGISSATFKNNTFKNFNHSASQFDHVTGDLNFDGNTFEDCDNYKFRVQVINIEGERNYGSNEEDVTEKGVVLNETTGVAYDSIREAVIAASEGAELVIAPGKYDLGEPAQIDAAGPNGYYLRVDKSLSFVGNGEVTITTSHEAESNIGGTGSLQNLITVDAANVSFKNITFKANYNGFYGGPNKIIEVRNTGFSISDCKFIPNEKASEDCGSAVYFSQKADNGVVENCEINYATVSFDGLMNGNFTVKGNKFVEGNGNFAITTPNWTNNDVTTSNLYVNLEGNNFEGFEEFNGSNPAIRGYYGILNLKDNIFPSDGQYWKASQFGSIFVDYDSPVSQTWTKDSNEPKSFAISNDIIELETTTDKETYGKMVGHGATVPGMTTDADMWEVVSMLTITDERQPVGKRIFVDVEEEGSVIEYVGIQFVRDENGNGKWQYYFANADDGEPWIPFENINTEPGEYEVKITYDNGIITYSIISIEGESDIKNIPLSTTPKTRISAIYLISKVCENSYKTTWSYPIVNF